MSIAIPNIDRIEMINIKMPLVHPFQTSFGIEKEKKPILIKIIDVEGNVGWGETTVMDVPSYCYETTKTAWYIQKQYLIPRLNQLNKGEMTLQQVLDKWKPVRGHEFAKGGIEAALWSLVAEYQGNNLGELYGATKEKIPTGVSIGIQKNIDALIKRISDFLSLGYKRIKIKIQPGWDVDVVKQVRREYEHIDLMVDANSSYSLKDIDLLKQLDSYNLMMIEQPLAYNDLLKHKKLQEHLDTPICLDESIHNPSDAKMALEFKCCEIINIKPGRVGGFKNAIDIAKIGGSGRVWCGGMLETGIGRLHNVFFQARNEFNIPGDTSGSNRYYKKDIIDPQVVVDENGMIEVPKGTGLAFNVDTDQIKKYTIKKEEINF